VRRSTRVYGTPRADVTLALAAFVTTILAGGAVLALAAYAAFVALFSI